MKDTTNSGRAARDNFQSNLIALEELKELIESILPDASIAAELDRFGVIEAAANLPPHYDNDVAEHLIKHFGGHGSNAVAYRSSIKDCRSERKKAERKAKREAETPSREVYFQLFKQILGPLPRDLFSGKCMVKHDGLWEPAQNFLPRVRSEAYDLKGVGAELIIPAIDAHFFEFECAQPRIFIPTVPPWDGVDRIQQMAQCVKLDGTQSLPSNAVEQFLKSWCAGIWRKMSDPAYQNPVLILKGPQGIGKDVFIDTLSGGFEQWSKDLILSHNDKDNYTQLSRAAVLRIAEFERTSKTDLATIKDMIFRKFTFLRPSHQPEFRDAQCRASFVASCNTDDIYRDSTGNRRYVVFNLASIDWTYSADFDAQKQILAQGKQLAAEEYRPTQMALDAMGVFLQEKTPESIENITLERWEHEVEEWIKANPTTANETIFKRKQPWITNEEAVKWGIFDKLTKNLGIQTRTARQHLKSEGLGVNARPSTREPKARGFLIEQPEHLKNSKNEDDVPEIDFD